MVRALRLITCCSDAAQFEYEQMLNDSMLHNTKKMMDVGTTLNDFEWK